MDASNIDPNYTDVDLAHFFHENTKRNFFHVSSDPDMIIKPSSFKEYPNAPRFFLPKNNLELNILLNDAILKRRSCRNFADKNMSIENLSKILWYGYGISEIMHFENFELLGRPAPSAGALYPLEIYPIVFKVEGLDSGIYHYSPVDHSLEFLKEGDFRHVVANLFMRQFYVANSSLCIVISGVLERTTWKYGDRGYRYLLLEAGHVSQNIFLTSIAEGLATLPLGGFFDNSLSRFIGIDSDLEPVIYGLAIGYSQ